jgi:hypothetical protein
MTTMTEFDASPPHFRFFVEQKGGWRLLWNDNDGSEKGEEAAQLVFRGVAEADCRANCIVIDREVDLGRGPIDFKFSNPDHSRVVVDG